MTADPVVIVSNDTHIGPRLVEDLRPDCPARNLDDFVSQAPHRHIGPAYLQSSRRS